VAGDLVGGKLALDSANYRYLNSQSGSILHAIGLVDQAKINVPMHVILFNQDPSNTTFTDNAAFDVADNDMAKIIGFASVSAYTQLNDNSYGYAAGLNMPIPPSSGQIYAAFVAQAGGTYVATTDLIPSFHFIPTS
jgi:hypothetical protein